MSTTVVSIRIDAQDKEQATSLLGEMGLNLSTYVNMAVKQLILSESVPFAVEARKRKEHDTLNISAIRDVADKIGKKYSLKRLFLFGSYAKGTERVDSDIDFLFEKGETMSFITLASMRDELEKELGKNVDVVSLNGIDDEFLNEISGTEVLLYEA